MEGVEQTKPSSSSENNEENKVHSEADFERWLDSSIGTDQEVSAVWNALRDVIMLQLKDGETIRAATLYPLILKTIQSLLDDLHEIKLKAIKSKEKDGTSNKKFTDAHEIAPWEVTMAMHDKGEQMSNVSIVRLAATSRLLQYTSSQLPDAVVCATLSAVVPVLSDVSKEGFQHTIMVPILTVVSNLLCKVPGHLGALVNDATSLFGLALNLVVSGKPKVRKRAIRSVQVILEHFQQSAPNSQAYELFTKLASTFAAAGFQNVSVKNTTVALYTMELLKHVIHAVPVTMQKSWCSSCLSLPSLCSPILTQCAFHVLGALFIAFNKDAHSKQNQNLMPNASTTSKDKLPKAQQKLAIQLINSLFTAQPGALDFAPSEAFCESISHGFVSLTKCDEAVQLMSRNLPKLFGSVVPLFKSGNSKAEQAAFACLKLVLTQAISEEFLDSALDLVERQLDLEAARSSSLYTVFNHLVNSFHINFRKCWHQLLQITGFLFERLGKSTLTDERIVNLASVKQRYAAVAVISQQLMHRILSLRSEQSVNKHVDSCLRHALLALGIAKFIEFVPIAFPDGSSNVEGTNLWILPFLREGLSHSELEYFYNQMVPSAHSLIAMSEQQASQDRLLSAKHLMTLHNQIWAVFPRFCTGARDIADSFAMIAETLGIAIEQSQSIRVDVVNGLHNLISKTRASLDLSKSEVEEFEKKHETELKDLKKETESIHEQLQILKDKVSHFENGIQAIQVFVQNFLPVLFNVFVGHISPEERNAVSGCIQAFLTISDSNTTNTFFKDVVSKLLTTTTTTNASKSNSEEAKETLYMVQCLTGLAAVFVQYLEKPNLEMLYKTILPNLQPAAQHISVDSVVQKKSWKVLRAITEQHQEFVTSHLADLQALIAHAEIVGTSKIFVIKAVAEIMSPEQLLAWLQGTDKSFAKKLTKELAKTAIYTPLPTVVLGWRETSARTRQASSATMESFGKVLGVEKLIALLVMGLSSNDAHFKAATVASFTLMLQTFPSELATVKNGQHLFSMLKTSILLLDWQAPEVRTATLNFIKSAIKPTPASILVQLLPNIVRSVIGWPDNVKSKYMKEIRVLLERLIRKFGYDKVAAVMPKLHIKFLQNINQRYMHKTKSAKMHDKKSHKKDIDADEGDMDWSDLEDDDDEVAELDSSKKSKKSSKKSDTDGTWLREDLDDENPLDFTEASVNKNLMSVDPAKANRKNKPSSNPFSTTEDGRLVIDESIDKKSKSKANSNAMNIVTDELADELEDRMISKKRKRADDAAGSDDESKDRKPWFTSKGVNDRPKRPKLDPTASAKNQINQFKSSRGAGDARRAGQAEPHAYVKPNPAFLNKRHKNQSVKQYEALIGKKSKK